MKDSIRLATKADSEKILEIYAPYVRDTTISFEIDVPSLDAFQNRVESISKQYPYLVYISGGEIIGYAYASRHAERAAYCYDTQLSVYLAPSYHGKGVAHKLYTCLFEILREQGYYNAYAGYTIPNEKSKSFHTKFGFTLVGIYHKTGYKFGQWRDVAWNEKRISDYIDCPQPVKAIHDLPPDFLDAVFSRCLA